MKKIIFILFISLVTIDSAFTQNRSIIFDEPNFAKALERAKKENKNIFVDCYTSWCGPCKTMSKEVFTNDEVADYFNTNYINLKFDMEKNGVEFGKKYPISGYPTFIIINPDGKELCRVTGSMTPKEFIKAIDMGGKPEFSLSHLEEQYSKGERSMEFYNNYLAILTKSGEHDKVNEIISGLKLFTNDDDIKDRSKWLIFNKFQNIYESKDTHFFLKNIEKFKSFYDSEVDVKLDVIYSLKIVDYVYFESKFPDKKLDISELDNFIAEMQAINFDKSSTTLAIALTEQYIRNKEYLKAAQFITTVRNLNVLSDKYFDTYFGMIFLGRLFSLTQDKDVLRELNNNINYLSKNNRSNPTISEYKGKIDKVLM